MTSENGGRPYIQEGTRTFQLEFLEPGGQSSHGAFAAPNGRSASCWGVDWTTGCILEHPEVSARQLWYQAPRMWPRCLLSGTLISARTPLLHCT